MIHLCSPLKNGWRSGDKERVFQRERFCVIVPNANSSRRARRGRRVGREKNAYGTLAQRSLRPLREEKTRLVNNKGLSAQTMKKKKNKKKNTTFIRNLFWLVLFFVAAILIIWSIEKKQAKIAGELSIVVEDLPEGNNLLTKEDVLERLQKSFVIGLSGQPIGALDVKQIEAVLEEDPFVKAAEVYINAKNKVHIELKQRVPLLRVIDAEGENYYLDKVGNKMPLSKHFTAKVLVANGSIPPHIPNFLERPKHPLRDLFELTKRILEDDFMEPLVAQIYRDDKGSFTLVPIVGNQNIVFGPYEQVEDKFFRLEQFYLKAVPYTGWNKYKTINLTFKNQVVCEKR